MDKEVYEVYYRETLIGILTVDVDNRYCYEVDVEGVNAVKNIVPLLPEMIHGTDGYVDPIPFFQSRIRNMKRWSLKELNYQTDYFMIKQIY